MLLKSKQQCATEENTHLTLLDTPEDASSCWKPFANLVHVARATVPAFFSLSDKQPRKIGNSRAYRLMWAPRDAAGHLRWKLWMARCASQWEGVENQSYQRRKHSGEFGVGIGSGEAGFSSSKQRVKNQRVTETFQPKSSSFFFFLHANRSVALVLPSLAFRLPHRLSGQAIFFLSLFFSLCSRRSSAVLTAVLRVGARVAEEAN